MFSEPEKPQSSDCCGSGCSPCVFDIYEQRLRSWQAKANNENSVKAAQLRTDLLSETCFKPFRLMEKRQLTDDVFLIRFQAVDNLLALEITQNLKGTLPYDVGQHLVLRCTKIEDIFTEHDLLQEEKFSRTKNLSSNKDKIITRAYTPITIAKLEEDCYFDVFVKLYKNGIASNYLHQSDVGEILYWRGPYGKFQYKPNSYSYILMLCMGSGLAPMIPVLKTVLGNECDESVVKLMFGVKNINHVIMRDFLREMTQYWNFTLEYYFSDSIESNDSVKFGENISNKRIDKLSVGVYVTGKTLSCLLVLICGSASFTSALESVLSDLGVDHNNIHIF